MTTNAQRCLLVRLLDALTDGRDELSRDAMKYWAAEIEFCLKEKTTGVVGERIRVQV